MNDIILHDLRKNPKDLPKFGRGVLARSDVGTVYVAVYVDRGDGQGHWFYTFGQTIVAWCELPDCMRDDDERDEGGIDIEAEEDPGAGAAD